MITIKILPHTTRQCKRLSITNGDIRVIYPWNHDYDGNDPKFGSEVECNCIEAFEKYAKSLKYTGKWMGGHTKDGMAFVPVTTELTVNL